MKKLLVVATMWIALSASANLIINPDFTLGSDGLDFWEAYDVPSVSGIDPSLFVTPNSGIAAVAGYSAGETAFYQTFAVGALASGDYTWSATLSNVSDPAAFMFIKVFTGGDFNQFDGTKFQQPTLTNGVMTLSYTHDTGDLVQFGFSGFSASQGFEVGSPTINVVPEPGTLGFMVIGIATSAVILRRRRLASHV
ncbi:MAG: PEP-CTERM sorting domain-containing protein [Kiritimatiellae bacterium]|nr:PEP-CTERM sorting domain-containing protein [Kiritimatiellia bacterium]